jgi:4-amino-4-deoxy-L-arabinose transferase-like glycosyltransferase
MVMRNTAFGLHELEIFLITWLVCFALVACVIYLVDASRPPDKKIGIWKARIPSLVMAMAFIFFKYMMP